MSDSAPETIYFTWGDLSTEVVPVDIHRAYKVAEAVGRIFEPIIEPVKKPDGSIRKPDVLVKSYGGMKYIIPDPVHRGLSNFDRAGVFRGQWGYFLIPKGTRIPSGLVISKDKWNERYEATHYTIAPLHTMLLSRYVELVDDLRRASFARAGAES